MVAAETARFLYGDRERDADDGPRQRRWWLVAAAAALAAVCLPALIVRVATWRDPLRKLKTIAATLPTRLIEGRLDDFEYTPFLPVRSVREAEDTVALRAEAERLREQRGDDAGSRHARGIVLLLTGDATGAVQQLSTAARMEPDNAAFWNDLAAAQLARHDDSHAIAVEALAAADRALSLSPSFAAAHFNRALCLEVLARPGEAARAYRRARDLESHSRWSGEIAARIALLQE